MNVAGLAIDASNRSPIVLLRDPSGRRQVPIWIDHAQAQNILAGIEHPKDEIPLSHDLMVSLIKAGNLLLEKVIIHAIEEKTFRAILKMKSIPQKNEKSKNEQAEIELDARPSDAIALAIRMQCSIWMLEEIVAVASIPVDASADAEDQDNFHRFIETLSPADLIRHLKDRSPDIADNNDPDNPQL